MRKRYTGAVLLFFVAALALGVSLATKDAEAHPSKTTDCSGCHDQAPQGPVTAVPSTTTPAAGAGYSVAITIGLTAPGDTGYHIAQTDAAGTTNTWTTVSAGETGTEQTSWTASMTAPTAPGTYYYNVWCVKGPTSAGMAQSARYSITVPAPTVSYTITASAGTGGSIDPSGAVSVTSGADQSFAISADAGYHIVDVTVDGSSVGAVSSYPFTNVTANHTIVASFAADATTGSYTITASAGTGGSIDPSGAVSVTERGKQKFKITPASGYRIANVLVDGRSVGAVSKYTFSNVTSDHTIVASFERRNARHDKHHGDDHDHGERNQHGSRGHVPES